MVRLSREGRREEAHDLFDAYLPPVSYEQQQGVGVHADCWDASRAAQDRGDPFANLLAIHHAATATR